MEKHKFSKVYRALNCLTLFQGVVQDKTVQCYHKLLGTIMQGETTSPLDLLAEYHRLVGLLLEETIKPQIPVVGNPWQNHLLNRILFDDHIYARQSVSEQNIPPMVEEAFLHDLNNLQIICLEGWQVMEQYFSETPGVFSIKTHALPEMAGHHPLSGQFTSMKKKLLAAIHWPHHLKDFKDFYKTAGFGEFARYWAFRWEAGAHGFHLSAIEDPDPIQLQQLIGYERQRKQILSNTERLLKGQSAHNLLLYGDRGTGKSSSVKALLHKYGPLGLRLVQVSRKNLHSLQSLTRLLRTLPQKFIIFIDDLSFEESETEYKEFKTQLEGSLEQQPSNVCIYVTSNQRNLIKEYFGDRTTKVVDGEIHVGDTMQEKLSLVDRFGLKITFLAPDKEVFLEIVRELANQEGIHMDPAALERLAIQWTLWNNERSGRTARQFIDHIKGSEDYDIF
ncbi:protein of unknown function DUF815 [Desulforamulus reducens MI-1]|uniref:AAA+ ATPase domain-containing protein n=1 Tax=Desulforamulus reducens (strain ATCC BAA-1160 / DSM 100696 / MI-1) TaxID=349161 RepID=A4J8F5_DESRM|nr:ATP-binding protein [Desulforamulus reducens]ABO51358.1 protein of unknown function DUF815 [Desulforamulus reducens MI-1]